MNWEEYKLSEICEIRGGKRLPANHVLTDEKTSHPYVKARDIRGGKINCNNLQFVSDETYEFIKRYIVDEGDVCITIVANIGDVGIVPKFLHKANLTENAVRLTNFDKESDSKFINLLLSQSSYKNYMELMAAGAAQAKLGIYKIEQIKITLPPLPVQRRIAEILGRYDTLIENYTAQIRRLEAAAQNLYAEWFVRGRCPFAEYETGAKLPVGWEIVKLGDVLELRYGKSLIEEIRDGGKYPVVGSSGIVDYHSQFLVGKAGIVVGRKGNVGSVYWIDKPFFPIDTAFYVESEMSLHYLFFNLQTQNFISGDAAVPGLNREQALSNKMIKPSDDVLEKFDEITTPIFYKTSNLQTQITKLHRMRDKLLPRLLSGKLPVKVSESEKLSLQI
ncbi:MAG TPA: restriction endonuclease subunit S [Pyrinomonadaceae bacterium]|nr:restriction endonuclease subunit S [Pyrinomonadaceae bacterium]